MNAEVEKALRESGWTPGRFWDPADALSELSARGYELWPAAVKMMSQFGGLRISFRKRRRSGAEDWLVFDPVEGACDVNRERVVEDYAVRVGGRLVPVGEVYSGHMVVLLDERGRVFGGYDNVLVMFGESIDAALKTIVLDEEPVAF